MLRETWINTFTSDEHKFASSMPGLLERLKDGGTVVIAEGYVWEIERRGFMQFGNFLPEVVLKNPEVVKQLHEEFAHAGSDVIEAFTYYGHREMFRLRGREADLEALNRKALSLAREVADKHGKLMAGNLSNTPLYEAGDTATHDKIYDMFKEQVLWAVEGGADFIIGETFSAYGEAAIALKAIREHGNGLPAVITMTAHVPERTTDDIPIPEACRRLEEAGAAVVGLNCSRGPDVMMPLIKEIKKICKVPIAALPVPYRTNMEQKTFFNVKDSKSGERVYPDNLDCVRCSRIDIRRFAEEALAAGVQYVGLCCGNSPNLTRELAEVYGKDPPASHYRTRTDLSMIFGEAAQNYGSEVARTSQWMTGDGL
ncbi:betaine--homocysteine S-methyltransferase 1-like [Mya arenaria]|uniref:betaine--homocysteine S-methyltransferase 1-like n=1 Tax=Mya arenaria TaxID=6604 RepID=UPI0022E57DB7|nr:betaine--homocysteine S-methyltransferase 1-like [Mya arenaria]XP_052811745.1 betaine--homocysteine S-methyltransferase 1-like [Mya arenaria]